MLLEHHYILAWFQPCCNGDTVTLLWSTINSVSLEEIAWIFWPHCFFNPTSFFVLLRVLVSFWGPGGFWLFGTGNPADPAPSPPTAPPKPDKAPAIPFDPSRMTGLGTRFTKSRQRTGTPRAGKGLKERIIYNRLKIKDKSHKLPSLILRQLPRWWETSGKPVGLWVFKA